MSTASVQTHTIHLFVFDEKRGEKCGKIPKIEIWNTYTVSKKFPDSIKPKFKSTLHSFTIFSKNPEVHTKLPINFLRVFLFHFVSAEENPLWTATQSRLTRKPTIRSFSVYYNTSLLRPTCVVCVCGLRLFFASLFIVFRRPTISMSEIASVYCVHRSSIHTKWTQAIAVSAAAVVAATRAVAAPPETE